MYHSEDWLSFKSLLSNFFPYLIIFNKVQSTYEKPTNM